MTRIHILVGEDDKARYAAQAVREGRSLGAWLREAAEEKLERASPARRLDTPDALRAFFAECEVREPEAESDWAEHRAVIERSRAGRTEVT